MNDAWVCKRFTRQYSLYAIEESLVRTKDVLRYTRPIRKSASDSLTDTSHSKY